MSDSQFRAYVCKIKKFLVIILNAPTDDERKQLLQELLDDLQQDLED